jgi:hypothetical protein
MTTQSLPVCFTNPELINAKPALDLDNCVNIWAAPLPFGATRTKVSAPAGMSVAAMIAKAGIDVNQFVDARVDIDGEPVPREAWWITFPQPDSLVNIRAVPQGGGGGGKSPLRTVLSIAVFAAASWASGGLAATNLALASSSTFGPATAFQVGISGGFIKAGVGAVGSLHTNAMLPPSQPRSLQ